MENLKNRWRKQDIKFLNWYSLIVTRYVKYRPGLHKYVQTGLLVCAPWARSNGCKSRTRPDSGKCIAEQQVHREVESEGRWRQISGLTNRNHIRLQLRIRLPTKPKSNNYSELTVVNVADIWRESDVWYQGRSRQRLETEYENR